MKRHRFASIGALLIGLSGWVAAVHGASLRALAPDDAGIYLELHHLATDVQQFQQGALFARWEQHPAWPLLTLKLHDRWRPVRDFLGLSKDRWWLDLLGDEALLAVWPGESSAAPGAALVLLRTQEHELLRTILQRVEQDVVAKQPQVRKTRMIADREITVYTLPSKSQAPPTQVTVLRVRPSGATYALMTSRSEAFEPLVNKIIAAEMAAEGHPAEDYRAEPTFRLTLQPRPWDALLGSIPLPTQPGERQMRQLVTASWQAFDSGTLSVQLSSQLRSELQLHWRHDALPTLVADLLEGLTGSTRLAAQATDDALLLAGGRVDIGRWIRAFMAVGPSESDWIRWPNKFEYHLLLSALTALGPDVCVALIAAQTDANSEAAWPVEWLAGIETQAIGGATASVAPSGVVIPWLQQALRFAETAELTRNPSTAVRTETMTSDGRTLLKLSGLPRWSRRDALVFTESAQTIWAGSSVELVERAGKATAASLQSPRATVDNDMSSLQNGSHFLIVDLARLRTVLASSVAGAARLAEAKQISVEQADREQKLLARLLDVGDRLRLTGRVTSATYTLQGELSAQSVPEVKAP